MWMLVAKILSLERATNMWQGVRGCGGRRERQDKNRTMTFGPHYHMLYT